MLCTTLFAALALANGIAGYTLVEDYLSGDFYSKFDFFTGADPTDGFVDYLTESAAKSGGLINTAKAAVFGVDSTTMNPSGGRGSVRISSKATYNAGSLVILDLEHMPAGVCGTWPAFWMLGANWPNNGEIDIIEGVNENSENQMTLHTSDGCTINNSGFSGDLITSNCWVDAPGQSANQGCSIGDKRTSSYGSGFNSNGGGVFATVWSTSSIDIYFFPRGSVPSDIGSGKPDPSSWGTPAAQYEGSCDISSHFQSQQIVFDVTFCGGWGSPDFSSGSCASKASSCQDYVSANPDAFKDVYWHVNALKVYDNGGSSAVSDLELPSSGNATAGNATAGDEAVKRQTREYLHRHKRHGKRHGQHFGSE